MSWLPVGISIIAADLSAISVMRFPAWGYNHNLELIWMNIALPLVAPIVILVLVPFYAPLNLNSAYEYLERRFDLKVRLVTSIQFQVLRGVHVAICIYAPGQIVNLVTGLPVWQSVLVMGLFTTFYTARGGMKGDLDGCDPVYDSDAGHAADFLHGVEPHRGGASPRRNIRPLKLVV